MNDTAAPVKPMSHQGQVLDSLVNEIMEKLEAGELIDLDTYAREYPDRLEHLRRLLPTLEVLADLGRLGVKEAASAAPVDAEAEALRGMLGDFRILREIGRGGMGVVYEAEQISMRRRVALKVLPFAAVMDPKQIQRFKNEALAAGQLQHTNIVPVYSVGCERGVHFYAMQFIEGQTLGEVMRELRRVAGFDGKIED